jgi:hypothetical protein
VVAAIAVVGGFYVCSQLVDRGVKYHTQEYWDAFYERGRLQHLRDKVTVLLRLSVNRAKRAERREKPLAGEARLIELGALEERSFDVFGHHPDVVVDFLTRQPGILDFQRALVMSRRSFRLATTESGEILSGSRRGEISASWSLRPKRIWTIGNRGSGERIGWTVHRNRGVGNMRKRIAIGVIAAVVIGAAGYALREPEHATLEYHKAEYLKVRSGPGCVGEWIREYGPEALAERLDRVAARRMARHRDVLIKLGYVARTMIVVSNAPVEDVVSRVLHRRCMFDPLPPRLGLEPKNIDWEFFSYAEGTNFIEIFCVNDDVREWQRAIGKADVDEKTWNEMVFEACSVDAN